MKLKPVAPASLVLFFVMIMISKEKREDDQ